MNGRTLMRIFVPLVLLGITAFALAGVASAHAFLVSSSPQPGERLAASPNKLVLQFTEAVAGGGDRVTLEATTRRSVRLGALVLSHGNSVVAVRLPHLTDGVYVVNWSVVSVADGHLSAGQYAFAVGVAGALPSLSAGTNAQTDWAGAVAGWLFLLGVAIAAGGLTSELLVWKPLSIGQPWEPPSAPVVLALIVAMIGASGLFVFFTRSLAASSGSQLNSHIWLVAFAARVGILSLSGFLLCMLALVVLPMRRWRATALLPLTLAAAAAALQTHPAATSTWWGTPAIIIHVVPALLWTGMLVHLVLVLWRQRETLPHTAMLAAVHRYASLALWSVALVLLTGVAAALAVFSNVSQLFSAEYGHILLVKIALIGAGLVLAAFGRLGAFTKDSQVALSLVRVVTRPEAITAMLILGVAALLSNVAPPFLAPRSTEAARAASLLGPPPPRGATLTLAGQAGWIEVYVTASTGQLTLRSVTPDIEANPHAIGPGERLKLWARKPHERETIDLFPRPCGPGCYSVHFSWQPGTTHLHVRIGTRRWTGGTLTFNVHWPPWPRDPQLLQRVVTAMKTLRTIELTERVTSNSRFYSDETFPITGRQFIASEPYSSGLLEARAGPARHGLKQLFLYLPGSSIWVHFWIGKGYRIQREVIVDPHHLIERKFSYGGRQ